MVGTMPKMSWCCLSQSRYLVYTLPHERTTSPSPILIFPTGGEGVQGFAGAGAFVGKAYPSKSGEK
jgi:hypothetical protein